ncbi:M35 family metallo-endopeptidase [Oceaniglobus roseus]|uniref:M35 family metallo-endopeptidase n=1 Tax=Oceaniglobus roseus TaxID=1737570 RepID=UPI00130013B1|nr:M35 family metallo-endopeptidase [Kandeliimicrobium roseum]
MFSRRFEGFNANQQQVIETACQTMAAMSQRAIIAPRNMALWFGAGQNAIVTPKLRMMEAVIADTARTVTFVNRAGGQLGVQHTDIYTKTLLAPGNFQDLTGVVAYAHPVDRRDEPGPKRTISHVGSGMRIYLNDVFFQLDATERAVTVYHELTHKVLATNDHAYDPGPCQALAINNPGQATDNADNFALFVAQC